MLVLAFTSTLTFDKKVLRSKITRSPLVSWTGHCRQPLAIERIKFFPVLSRASVLAPRSSKYSQAKIYQPGFFLSCLYRDRIFACITFACGTSACPFTLWPNACWTKACCDHCLRSHLLAVFFACEQYACGCYLLVRHLLVAAHTILKVKVTQTSKIDLSFADC